MEWDTYASDPSYVEQEAIPVEYRRKNLSSWSVDDLHVSSDSTSSSVVVLDQDNYHAGYKADSEEEEIAPDLPSRTQTNRRESVIVCSAATCKPKPQK